jgi:hypothetical protein
MGPEFIVPRPERATSQVGGRYAENATMAEDAAVCNGG